MRILMIAPTSFFSDYGCHVRILEETRALQSRGHNVTICTYHNGNDVPGLDIRRSLDVPWRKREIVGTSKHKLYLDAVLSLEVLRTALTVRPDLIHAHLHEGALIGGTLARILRKPLIFDYQGSLTEEMLDHGFMRRGGRRQSAMRWLEHAIDTMPDVLITSSDNARARLQQRGYTGKVRTMLDAVDTERFSPSAVSIAERQELRQYLGIPENARVIVYLGLLAPYQGSDLLLEAAQQILASEPDAYFLMMGFPGNERYRVRAEQLLGLGNRTSFPGRIPYVEAHRYLALGEVAVAPKMSLTEGNGKIYNYMSMGLPVVAFDAATNREILGDLGSYAKFGDSSDLADHVLRLLEHPESAAQRGMQLRQRAIEHLSWDNRIDELLTIYDECLGRQPSTDAVRPIASVEQTPQFHRQPEHLAGLFNAAESISFVDLDSESGELESKDLSGTLRRGRILQTVGDDTER